jgi:ADP-heptose:LPS heptosyltransferase
VRHTVSGHHIGPREEHTKRWADSNWIALARQLTRELGLQVISIGTPGERRLETEGVLDVHCLSILQVAGLLANASLMIAVDNGIYHLGQALRTPTVHLYPSWFDSHWVASDPEGPHVDLVADLRKLSVRRVLDTASELVLRTTGNSTDRTAVDGVTMDRARS